MIIFEQLLFEHNHHIDNHQSIHLKLDRQMIHEDCYSLGLEQSKHRKVQCES